MGRAEVRENNRAYRKTEDIEDTIGRMEEQKRKNFSVKLL